MRAPVNASGILAPERSPEWWLELGIRQQSNFWRKVKKTPGPDGCWIWTAGVAQDGSGKHTIQAPRGILPKQKCVRAPHFAWEMAHGLVPEGLIVYHQCEQVRCVRPAHLATGTQADSRAHCVTKGSTGRGERNSHAKLSEDTARLIKLLGEAGMPDGKIARRVGLDYRHVWGIRTGRAWRHVVANVALYSPNLNALYAERRAGGCIGCDSPLPTGKKSLCGSDDCDRVYQDAAKLDYQARKKIQRELDALRRLATTSEAA